MQMDKSDKHSMKCQLPVLLLDGGWKAGGSSEPLTFKTSLCNAEGAVLFPPPLIFMAILTHWLLLPDGGKMQANASIDVILAWHV